MANTIIRVPVDPVTIAADLTSPLGACPVRGTITRVTYTATALITGAAPNNSRTFTLFNRGQAGAGVVAVAILAMVVGVDAPADVARDITLGAAANLAVNVGDILDWESDAQTAAGGLVDPGGVVEVTIRPALN
jgi:hypothetical protein